MTASILAMAHMCRTCESETELISLSDAESKSIVKKLRACADISVSVWETNQMGNHTFAPTLTNQYFQITD